MRKLIILLTCLFIATSCNMTSTDILVINMDQMEASIDMKLSDILDDIAIVPLEDRKDLALSSGVAVAVTERYIIIADKNALFQFDKSGKYIKRLAERGNGPNEFIRIYSLFPDNQNNILYYRDIKYPNLLLSLNMETGTFLPSHEIDVTNFTIEAVDENGNIFGFPSHRALIPIPSIDSLVIIYRYDPKGGSVVRFKRDYEFLPRFTFANSVCNYKQELNFIGMSSDTLYRIEDGYPVPLHYFKYRDRKEDFSSNGFYFRLLFRYKDGLILQKCYNKTTVMGRGSMESNQPVGYFLLDNELRLNPINSLFLDPLYTSSKVRVDESIKIPVNTFPFPTIQGEWGYIIMEAINMIAWIDKSLSNDELPLKKRQELESLKVNLKEDSNPVLITGRVK